LADGPELTAGEFPQVVASLSGQAETPRQDRAQAAVQAVQNVVHMPAFQYEPHVLPDAPDKLSLLAGDGEVRTMAELEEEMIRFALDHYRGHMSEVARRLGIGRSTLYRRLRELGLDAAE